MSAILRMSLILAVAILPAVGPSCGTETGNPTGASQTLSTPLTAAESIRDALCERLVECHSGLTVADCLAGVNAATNIDTELGLSAGVYSSYSAIITAERNVEITAASSPSAACTVLIDALECTDPAVQAAYDSGSPDDFSNVAPMIPGASGSCPDVYP